MVLDRVHTEKSDSGDSTRPLRMLSYITAAMVSIFVAWFTGYIRTNGTLDTDGWFLLASGREIVHNGIPFENPWSLDSGLGIIVQQWLHDVWLYGWYSLAGYTGVATSVVVPLAIAAIAYYFLIDRLTRGCRHQGTTWLLYAVGFFQMFTYISIRPTLWSAGCLFVTLNILFAWHEDGNVRALWLLPVVTLLQVNLQAAMWPLCLAACLSFLLPEIGELHIKTFKTDMVAWYTYRIPLLRACLLMCIASLFNPYGFGGAIYTVLSMGAASYGNIISEMRPFISSPNDSYGIVCTMACIVIPVAIAIIKGKVPNTGVLAFWIAAVVMGVLKIRCFWIAWTVSFVVCAYLCGIGRTGIEREEEDSAIRLMPVLFIGVLLATSVLNASEAARSSNGTTASGWSAFDQETAPIVDALKGTDARIFSSDDTLMNYFEWEDIKVSYDMRPEIWAKAIAGERTHDDYKRYVDVVNAKSFKTLNDGYWDVAIIRKDEQRLFEKEVRGSEKIVSTSRYCLYRLK